MESRQPRPGEPIVVTCIRATAKQWTVEGAVIGQCDDCKCPIWLSPSSFELKAEYEPKGHKVSFLCFVCTTSREDAPADLFATAALLPHQLAEIRANAPELADWTDEEIIADLRAKMRLLKMMENAPRN